MVFGANSGTDLLATTWTASNRQTSEALGVPVCWQIRYTVISPAVSEVLKVPMRSVNVPVEFVDSSPGVDVLIGVSCPAEAESSPVMFTLAAVLAALVTRAFTPIAYVVLGLSPFRVCLIAPSLMMLERIVESSVVVYAAEVFPSWIETALLPWK